MCMLEEGSRGNLELGMNLISDHILGGDLISGGGGKNGDMVRAWAEETPDTS